MGSGEWREGLSSFEMKYVNKKKEFDFSFLIVFGLYDLVDVCICMYVKRAR